MHIFMRFKAEFSSCEQFFFPPEKGFGLTVMVIEDKYIYS